MKIATEFIELALPPSHGVLDLIADAACTEEAESGRSANVDLEAQERIAEVVGCNLRKNPRSICCPQLPPTEVSPSTRLR